MKASPAGRQFGRFWRKRRENSNDQNEAVRLQLRRENLKRLNEATGLSALSPMKVVLTIAVDEIFVDISSRLKALGPQAK